MKMRRIAAAAVLVASCAGADFRFDPGPSCSYRTDRVDAGGDGDTEFEGSIDQLTLGQRHGCAVFDEFRVRCWGGNDAGQLLTRSEPPPGEGVSFHPDLFGDFDEESAQVAVGGAHACAFLGAKVACWGNNDNGQRTPMAEPITGVEELDLGLETIVSASAGLLHTCATDGARIVCWGDNAFGQLGRDMPRECCNEPGDVSVAFVPLQVAAGALHTCVSSGDGEVHCWGDDRFGALGDGTADAAPRVEPMPVTLDGLVTQLTAGAHHTCAVTEVDAGGAPEQATWCWGRGRSGELGDGAVTDSAVPVRVDLPFDPARIVAGGRVGLALEGDTLTITDGVGRTCAVDEEGRAMCWGDNAEGQLGDGTTVDRPRPTDVVSDALFQIVDPGGEATCGVTFEDDLLCWGDGTSGQNGTADGSSLLPAPTTVFEF